MNKMQKTILGVGAMVIFVGGMAIANNSQAYKGDPNVQGPNYSAERHEQMEKAFENNDYEAWKSLMTGKGRVTQVINADNFSRFAEAHRLAESGDIEGAKKIRTELGLGLKNGSGMKQGQGKGQGMKGGNGSCQNN